MQSDKKASENEVPTGRSSVHRAGRRYRLERKYRRGDGADLWRVISDHTEGPWVKGRAVGAWKAYKAMRRASTPTIGIDSTDITAKRVN